MSPARPRRGRVHETYSKDPYLLSFRLAYVRGLQIDDATTGVAATSKHFVGSSTMRSHGRIGVCWSGRRDGCAMVSRFSSGRVGWSMSG
jgi:hypothetical protein